MEKNKFKYQNLNTKKWTETVTSTQWYEPESETPNEKSLQEFFQEKPEIFLLNNILMSVQFFENYERDIEVLRENWYKEFELVTHHKTCFYADSLFRLIGMNVKFKPRYGVNKDSDSLLHPLRIFVASDNIQAAYDPGVFGKRKTDITPLYRFTVKPSDNNKKEKSGYISLIQYRPTEKFISTKLKRQTTPEDSQFQLANNSKDAFQRNTAVNLKRKSTFDLKNSRTLTKTEKLIGLQSKNPKLDRRSSFRSFESLEDAIPSNGFYNYEQPKARIKEKPIQEFRMYEIPENSYQIPRKCFQSVEVRRLDSRRRSAARKDESSSLFTTRYFLNSAAYKGYFCDLIEENLAESLNLDPGSVNEGTVLEEFLIFKQNNAQVYITPIVKIQDWCQYVDIYKRQRSHRKNREIEWPTAEMNKVVRLLPCYAVPKGYSLESEENSDYEKEWKLCFPKAEEFLILHVMHAHLRCYFFILAIYKSFIEFEVNKTSFGPNHLLHLLFWRIHKNFLTWPEDRLGETLINFLKDLYGKLRNKSLCDFFISGRNLFSGSLPKDLHKVQAIVKKIIENPVPHVLTAVRNLESSFYPVFDVLKLNAALTPEKTKPAAKPKPKRVAFEEDEEREWKRKALKQINLEKKAEEGQLRKLSTHSIDTESLLRLENVDPLQGRCIVEMFISHFLEMGMWSVEQKFLDQAMMYTIQIQKLLELLTARSSKKDLEGIKHNLNSLKEKCEKLRRSYRMANTEQISKSSNSSKEIETIVATNKAHKEMVKILDESNFEEECETKL